MGSPPVHVAQQASKGNIVVKVHDVLIGLALGGVIVKHEKNARNGQNDKKIKRDSPHSPGKTKTDGIAIHLGGLQMQEDVGQNRQRPVAGRLIQFVAEDGFPDLGPLVVFGGPKVLFSFRDERIQPFFETVDQGSRSLSAAFFRLGFLCHAFFVVIHGALVELNTR